MRTIIATVGAVMTALTLGAQEADEKSAEKGEEEEESSIIEAGVDIDFFTAYVWRNAVQTDRMVIQPAVWADFTMLDPFYFGFNIWQDYDLTRRRRSVFRRSLTETDYNVHVGVTVWKSDDEKSSLTFEFGHEWDNNEFLQSDAWGDNPSIREFYLKATFDNPIVGVYGQASWMYEDFGNYKQGMHYELGLTKEVDLVEDKLTLGADWNVNFADAHYLYYLYGGLSNPYLVVEEGEDDEVESWMEDDFDSASKDVIGGTTLKLYLSWAITDWMALKGTIAYTGLLNGGLRQAHGDQNDENRDLLWGGFSMNFEF